MHDEFHSRAQVPSVGENCPTVPVPSPHSLEESPTTLNMESHVSVAMVPNG